MEIASWNIVVTSLTLLAIIVPFFCGYSLQSLSNEPVSESILTIEAKYSYGILMVSSIPFALDTALDYNDIYDKTKWKLYLFGRAPVAIGSILVGIQLTMISRTPSIFGLSMSRAESYLLIYSLFKVVFTGSMMYVLSTVKPSVFSGSLSLLFTILVGIVSIVRQFTPGSSPLFYQFSTTLVHICLIVFVIILLYWSSKIVKIIRCLTVEDYTCILYIFMYLFGMLSTYANIFYSWAENRASGKNRPSDFSSWTPECLAIVNYSFSFLFIMLAIAPGRIARFQAVVHLVSKATVFKPYYIA